MAFPSNFHISISIIVSLLLFVALRPAPATQEERSYMTHLKDNIVGAKDGVVDGAIKAKDWTGDKLVGAKDGVVDGATWTGEKIVGAKDGVVDGAVKAKDWTGEKLTGAKDGVVDGANWTGEKIVGAKDGVVDGCVKAKDWTGEKLGMAGEKADEVNKKAAKLVEDGAQSVGDDAHFN